MVQAGHDLLTSVLLFIADSRSGVSRSRHSMRRRSQNALNDRRIHGQPDAVTVAQNTIVKILVILLVLSLSGEPRRYIAFLTGADVKASNYKPM